MTKKAICTFLITVLFLVLSAEAYACTAVYVGKAVSADGTVIMAKSNDYQDVWANYVTITPRVENTPVRTMPVDNAATVFAPLPADTYRYTSTPWMDSATAVNGLGKDATICANEYGVTMIMSITSFSNEAALKADPLIENGITEFTAVDLVVCQSKTAREAVDVLCGLIDTYGSSEVNIALIADQQEAWYVEMYTGHQYAAVKLPEDRVCAFGNEFSLTLLSEYEDYVMSGGLRSLAEENGFAVYGGDGGELNLWATYSGQEVVTDYSHMRTWIGHQLLAPSRFSSGYDKNAMIPLCFEPDKKVSLIDVMEIMRNRFDGTEYSPDETNRTDMRVIGTETALSVHIAQIYPELPADVSCVTWESSGPALYGVFVPVSNAVTRISEAYGRNQSTDQAGIFDTELYPYYRFKELTTLCADKEYLAPVRAYWHEAELRMTESMAGIMSSLPDDGEKAARILTDCCCDLQEKAFEDAGKLLNDVRWYVSRNSNSLKNGRNPETHEVLDELKPITPLSVTLNPAAYTFLPFADVAADDPSREAIRFMYENGFMTGVSDSRFDPEGNLTRAMTAVILYRIEGEPDASFTGSFSDVPDGVWYTDAVEWAAAEKIVAGYGDNTFGPSDPVTWEQLAVILYRAAMMRGNDVSVESGSADGISPWAADAVSWASAEGICSGSGLPVREAADRAGAAEAFLAYAEYDKPLKADNLGCIHEPEFGGVYIALTIEEFHAIGFRFGDSLDITFSNGYTLTDLPCYNGYYTRNGEPLLVCYPGYDYIKACINNGDDLWIIAGLDENCTASIALHERGRYTGIQNARDITYSDDRAVYDSDVQFANFREISLLKGVYRGASPCDNQHNRADIVDSLLRQNGIAAVIDLADTPAKIEGYQNNSDYFMGLYRDGKVVPLAMNMNYGSEEFREKAVKGLRAMIGKTGPYYIHCTEGKDRTGFFCMLLEAVCGATYEEIVEDYMITYKNYYGITPDSERWSVIVENVLEPMLNQLTDNVKTADYAEAAEAWLAAAGMTHAEAEALRMRIMK